MQPESAPSAPPIAITRKRVSDDFIVLVLTAGYAVLVGVIWTILGRPPVS